MTINRTNGLQLNEEAIEVLEKELGEHYVDVIELEWNCSVCQFIKWFWDEISNGFSECGFNI